MKQSVYKQGSHLTTDVDDLEEHDDSPSRSQVLKKLDENNMVQKASEDSFPASDPPSSHQVD
jgi:hypothetical protein